MTLRRWNEESKRLSGRRMDLLVDGLTVTELIEYRDNYDKNRGITAKIVSVMILIALCIIVALAMLCEFNIIETGDFNLYFGYIFGFMMGMLIFGYTGSTYTSKLTKRIEQKCLEQLEEK